MYWANLFKIAAYPVIIVICYMIVMANYKDHVIALESGRVVPKLRIVSIALIALIVGVYSTSFNGTFWWGDLERYRRIFLLGMQPGTSAGIDIVFSLIQHYGGDFDTLLFFIAFITTTLVFLTYRKEHEATPRVILFLFLSQFFVTTVQQALKQSIACGLFFLAVHYMMQKKWLRYLLLTLAALTFHETAVILLILPVVCMIGSSDLAYILKIPIIILFVCFFPQVMGMAYRLLNTITPSIASEMMTYMDDSGTLTIDSWFLVAVKGFPYYLITAIGIMNRPNLHKIVPNYDNYLWVSVLTCLIYITSTYSYWMQRFIGYFYLPCFLYYDSICKYANYKSYASYLAVSLSIMTFRFMAIWYPVFV